MEEDRQKKPRFFYGWVIVAAGMLINASVMGIIYNCFSQFIKPVCEDLGFTRQAMSFNQTLISLIQVGVAFIWGQILTRFKLKNLMFFWAVAGPAFFFCYSFAKSIWVFYIISALMSVTMSILTVLPFSFIISNWFNKKRGLATGICFMGSGLGGMILNPLLSIWLEGYGWRMSFRILAVIMLVVAVPCVLLLRTRPQHMGLLPLGGDDIHQTGHEEPEGYTLAEAKRMPKFWIIALCAMLINMGLSSLVQTLSPHLTDNGYTASFAAVMVSVSMGAMALGKMVLGQLFDLLGTKKAALLSIFCGFLGLLGMITCVFAPALGLVVLGIGFGCSFGTVGNPIIVQNVFGKKDYGTLMGFVTACSNIGGAISPTVNGTVYDVFKSYNPAFGTWALMMAIVLACFTIYLPPASAERAKNAEGGK